MNYLETFTWKEISETPRIFESIRSVNDETMKKLVATIKKSKKRNFIAAGRGTSDNAITFFKYVLEVMSDYTVGFSAPSVVTLYKGKINYGGNIVLGCSQSGMAEDVLEVLKKSNEQGAITVAVTNNPDSPIAKEAKFHLYCNAGKVESKVATKTFSAQLYLLLWLAAELSNNRDDLLVLKNFHKEIELVMPEIDELTTEYAEKFKNIQSGFVISRGLTYAIALELALKISETTYIPFKGFAGSDFYHGPMALVTDKTPVIIFCAKNNLDEELQSIIRADQMKIIERVLSLNAPVLLVTNDHILSGKFKQVLDAHLNFNVPEEFTIFAFALFAQMLACKLSCLIGNNPDDPRTIEKDTITK